MFVDSRVFTDCLKVAELNTCVAREVISETARDTNGTERLASESRAERRIMASSTVDYNDKHNCVTRRGSQRHGKELGERDMKLR